MRKNISRRFERSNQKLQEKAKALAHLLSPTAFMNVDVHDRKAAGVPVR